MAKTTTEMQLVPLSKLVPYINNARTHSPEQVTKLRSSLREFGFVNPVIIDRDYGIIAGHGRVMAAKEEGIEEVPCVFVDYLTEAQKKAYIIADNRFAQDAGWDEELLRIEIEALQGMVLLVLMMMKLPTFLMLMVNLSQKTMILICPQHLRKHPLYSVGISGQSADTASCVAMPHLPKM